MKDNIIHKLEYAKRKRKDCVIPWIYCSYMLDILEELDIDKEIKRLKEEYMILQNAIDEVEEELQQRIDKAIEYIETHQLNFKKGTTTFGSERLSMEERKLLDILKGSDKE